MVPHVREQSAKVEFEIAKIAARQHGVIAVGQLRAVGIDKSGVARRVRAGRLHPLHRGVYAVGHAAPSEASRFMAAVRACGEDAVLSHISATVLWGFLKPVRGPVHVTSPSGSGKKRRDGIVLHRSPSLANGGVGRGGGERLVTKRRDIPVTTPRRTIEDLEGTVPGYVWRRAKRQAEFRGYRLNLPTDRSRSDLEGDFLRFFARRGLLRPAVNVKVGKHEVDFLWPEHRLVVEADYFGYHRGSVAFEEDHRRELDLRRAGYTVRRYTGGQLAEHPAEIAAELAEHLGGEVASVKLRGRGA